MLITPLHKSHTPIYKAKRYTWSLVFFFYRHCRFTLYRDGFFRVYKRAS